MHGDLKQFEAARASDYKLSMYLSTSIDYMDQIIQYIYI